MIFKSSYPDVEYPNIALTPYILERMAPYGDKAAIIDGPSGRTLTYNQLAGGIKAVAAGLHSRGFGKGDVMCIYSPNVPEYAIAFHAVSLVGGVVTTANPLYTADELAHQCADAGAKYILTISMFLDKAQEAAKKIGIEEVFTFDPTEGATPFAMLMEPNGTLPDVDINPAEDLIVLPYSSGTTGMPKGVMLTHQNIVANIAQVEGMEDLDFTNDTDTIMGVLPFYHIYGMVVIMNMSLAVGATIVSMPRFDPVEFLTCIQKYKVTKANLVPPILVFLAKHPVVDNFDMSSFKEITSGAAPLGDELAAAVSKRLDCRVLQGYGMTETSPVATINPNADGNPRYASCGKLVANFEVKVADLDSLEDLDVGESGEIWMRGPNIMKGYLNRPDATANTITEDGWLRSGDIGYMDEDGYMFIVDRLKELIKYKGFQVAPAELEALLLGHEAVADVAIIPVADEEAGEIPKAFIVKAGEIDEVTIMEWVAGQVAPHKKIRLVEFVDSIPKSASGKILRRVLVEQERAK
ncbi:MAG: acyl-CoA synthetase (AMP-forming)/AMP-acid ligase II [Cellvibrionaceae bacterium]|jgi:acyl-CoA synthetase (AMP-forming)/AMP-acid ligase II